MKRDHKVLDEATHLQLVVEEATEQFLCHIDHDSEWRRFEYENDGTQTVVTYEVTDEMPPDRSVILKRWDNGDEFVITWNVSVSKREKQ